MKYYGDRIPKNEDETQKYFSMQLTEQMATEGKFTL